MTVLRFTAPPPVTWPALLRCCVAGGIVGLVSGGIIGFFRWTHDAVYAPAHSLAGEYPLGWWLFLLVAGVVVSLFMERMPQTRSSGIPVVEDDLEKDVAFPWLKILWMKFVGTWLVLLGGLSVGREGPSIEMGAATGFGLSSKLFPPTSASPGTPGAAPDSSGSLNPSAVSTPDNPGSLNLPMPISTRDNPGIMSGACAGLSAAFGAPLGGIAFVLEEMRCRFTLPMFLTLVAAALATEIPLRLFGLGPMFPFSDAAALSWSGWWMMVPLAVTLGVAGAGYNSVLLTCTALYDRAPFPPHTRALPPLIAAGILLVFAPSLLAGGEALILGQTSTPSPLGLLALLLIGKFLFSILCAASSVPGGLLMPMLCLGGTLGSLLTRFDLPSTVVLTSPELQLWTILGMSGFFAASVRAPITGALLTIQMTGAYSLTPEALVMAFIAGKTADLLRSPPIYEALRGKA